MTTRSRRRVLKGLGVALPAAWVRPVVEAVVLPAHAQTSELPIPPVTGTCSVTGPSDITLVNNALVAPFDITITNTGDQPLAFVGFTRTANVGFSLSIGGTPENPLMPGENDVFTVLSLSINDNCQDAVVTFTYDSDLATCSHDVQVTCADLG